MEIIVISKSEKELINNKSKIRYIYAIVLNANVMRFLRFLCAVVFLFTFSNLRSQDLSKEERKVQIFTDKEKDNLQIWFHKEVDKMNFSEEQTDDYYSVILYYVSKISRLDDKDKNFTQEEFKQELNKLLAQQNTEFREMLTAERFDLHLEIYGEFLRSAYKRWNITN